MTEAKDATQEELLEFLSYGNLGALTEAQKSTYLVALSKSLGLNPYTRPFDFLVLNGKTMVYANKGCASQLRALKSINIIVTYAGALELKPAGVDGAYDTDIYEVRVVATNSDVAGVVRSTPNVGTCYIGGAKGDNRANAIMRAYTKAMRRATLDHVGIGFPDESELETIPGVKIPDQGPKVITPAVNPIVVSGSPTTLWKEKVQGLKKSEFVKPAVPPVVVS